MNDFVKTFLGKKGYTVNQGAFDIFDIVKDWYTNTEESFHKKVTVNGEEYNLEKLNFAKRVCADDANLVETVEINAGDNDSLIQEILNKNNFVNMYRKQVEELSAYGTVGAYPRLVGVDLYDDNTFRGGTIEINYCNALNIVPLRVKNDEIVECAFYGTEYINNKPKYSVVMFVMEKDKYVCHTHYLDENGREIEAEYQRFEMSDVKPFAILRVAENNNLKMKGYGYPKLWNAIPSLKIVDQTITMWNRDLDKSDKIVLVNQQLGKRGKDGKIQPPTNEMRKIFVQIGSEKLPQEGSLYQEYNPSVRVAEVKDSLELALSMLSMMFGYGTKRYTFEQGRIVSATEYIGERQDSMQEVNKQRDVCTKYINELVQAIVYLYNVSNQTNVVVKEVMVDYDDTFVEDRQAMADRLKADALSFGIDTLTVWYLMKRYNITEKEAKELLSEAPSKTDGTELEE